MFGTRLQKKKQLKRKKLGIGYWKIYIKKVLVKAGAFLLIK